MASSRKNRKKNRRKNDRKITIGLIAVIAIFIFIIYKLSDFLVLGEENYDLSGEEYYQYFYGIREEYSGNMEVVINEDNIQLILENGQVIYLDSTPIYYTNVLGKVLFAQEMEVIIPDGRTYRLNKFTNVIEENNAMYVKKYNSENKIELSNAFLFDGSDLYFFLEDTTIVVGDEQYEVSGLSYAVVNYRQSVEIYDYESGDYIIIQDEDILTSDILAVNNARNYTINMSLDSLITTQNQYLLITNINNINEFEY